MSRSMSRNALAASMATAVALVSTAAAVLSHSAGAATGVPRPDHVVVAVFENKKANSIFGSASAPYINSLANAGAKFTQSFAIEHPSEPNSLDLFSGANQGVTDDSCPHTFNTDNEGAQLIAAGLSFTGYSEGLPTSNPTVCTSGNYARKHNPWVNSPTCLPRRTSRSARSRPTSSRRWSSHQTISFHWR